MTILILDLAIGDVAISASSLMSCVTVEEQHSVMKTSPAIIAAPAPAAHGTGTHCPGKEKASRVPEVRCWTSQNHVRTEDATQITTQASI